MKLEKVWVLVSTIFVRMKQIVTQEFPHPTTPKLLRWDKEILNPKRIYTAFNSSSVAKTIEAKIGVPKIHNLFRNSCLTNFN